MELYDKYSITPFSFDSSAETEFQLPFSLGDIRVESIEGLLRADNFSLWEEYLTGDLVKFFSRAKVALVHHFRSGFVTSKDEEDSKELLQMAFHCLRVVKPTRTRFSVVQYRKAPDKEVDVLSLVYPGTALRINLPESEVLNQIKAEDLNQLKLIWPSFRNLRVAGPPHLRRAMRYYETSYETLGDGDLQLVTWVTGIEALYSHGDEPCGLDEIKARILRSVGPDTDIYEGMEGRWMYAPKPLLVKDVLDNLFELRDRFIHGAWAPKSWLEKSMRPAISGRPLTLPDVLREAASFILRIGIQKILLSASNGA
jgi:hypothetical protein